MKNKKTKRLSADEPCWLIHHVAGLLKSAKENAGISSSELARRMGVSRAYSSQLLAGHYNLTLRQLLRVANALGCEVDLRMYRSEELELPKRKPGLR